MNKQFLLAALWLSSLGLYAHKANGIGAVTWKNEAPKERMIRGIDEDKTHQRFTLSGYVNQLLVDRVNKRQSNR